MSAPQWRILVIVSWIALTCLTFISIGNLAARSWLLLFVSGVIPPAMLLWLWTEDAPHLLGTLYERNGHR
jgi:hypothetical protein